MPLEIGFKNEITQIHNDKQHFMDSEFNWEEMDLK